MTTLGHALVEVKSGFACGEQDADGLFQFRMNNVTRTGTLNLADRRRVPPDAHRRINSFLLREGDVVFNATNSPDGVGRAALIRGLDEPAVFSNHFLRLRTDPTRLDPGYLSRWINWNFQRGVFHGMCRQWVNQATVSREALLGMAFGPPPIEEQRRIAAILDHVDSLRGLSGRRLKGVATLEEAAFRALFGNAPATATVDDISSQLRTGPFGSQLLHSEFVDKGVAVLGLDNVVGNEFRWGSKRFISESKYHSLRRYTVHAGDVLISIMGTTGRCVVVPEGIPLAINTKHICAVTPNSKVLPAFVRAAFLWHPESRAHLQRQTKGSIMDGLNMGIIRAMPVPVPSLEAQSQYVQRVEAVARERQRASQQLAGFEQLFSSLQARAFSGRL